VSVVGKAAFRLAHRLRGSQSLRILSEIADEPNVSPEEALSRQLMRLRALVAHADKTVPYYRELFGSIGLKPEDVRSFDDYAKIPILTKQILRERQDDLVSSAFDRASLLTHNSGGSTGVPIRYLRDQRYMDDSDAATYRNLMQCGWRPGDMVAFVWGFSGRLNTMSRIEFEARQHLRRFYQFNPFVSSPADFDRWITTLNKIRATAFLGYSSTIGRLARHMLETGRTVKGMRGVFTTAERLYPQQREDIGKAFGCHVYDLYGSAEVQNIASECAHGSMHINADYCHLEVGPALHEHERPLIVTSLKSLAFPFIRYQNGDAGQLTDQGTCNCGSGFPVMRLTVARQSDNFVFRNGRVVHGQFFIYTMYGSEGVESFQFHQVEIDKVIIRIVPTAGKEDAARRSGERAAAEVRRQAAVDVPIEIELVDRIEFSSAGKHRFTRSDIVAPHGLSNA
jgi:phenylacetate-CoA ligase